MSNSSGNYLVRLLSIFFGKEDRHFAVETVRNVIIFFVIAFVALGLQDFIAWLEQERGAGKYIVGGLTLVEYALLTADIVWFVSRLVVDSSKEVIKAYYSIKALYRQYSSNTYEPPSCQ